MALAQDQRAMLQLLLERGQSYEDIAGLLGGSRDEVRKRARAALEELSGADPDREVGLTDYLLGQADPIGRADVVRHLQSDPEALAQAEELEAKLRLLAPDAELPDLPEPKKRRRAAAPVSPASPGGGAERTDEEAEDAGTGRSRLGAGLTPKQTRMFAGLAAGAVILLFAILAVAGVFGGDEESSTPAETTATSESGSTATDEVAQIALEPQGDSEAGGEAIVGLANETQPFVDLRIQGLPEIDPQEDAYLLWFIVDDQTAFPIPQPLEVNQSGGYNDRLAIPVEALGIVAQSRELAISSVNQRELQQEITKAVESAANGQGSGGLALSGDVVLRGEVPRIPADAEAEGAVPPAP